MSVIAAVIDRLRAEAPSLRTVGDAASLAALMADRALPQAEIGAHVVLSGLSGGAATASTSAYVQALDLSFAVIITCRTRAESTGPAPIEAVVRETIAALVGWAPDDQIDVCRFVRAQLGSVDRGTIVYTVEFAIGDQLRILS